MNKKKDLLEMFLTLLKIGLFTFGGGYAMLALLESELVSKKKWLEKDEFLDMVAIAESTPGPIAINSATYIGYKKGGVLENPTAFGINGNNLMVGGEAGAEAVAPIDVLQGYVANAVASQNAGLITFLEQILNAILMMDENMGGSLREALEGTSLKINNREFGRLVRTVV